MKVFPSTCFISVMDSLEGPPGPARAYLCPSHCIPDGFLFRQCLSFLSQIIDLSVSDLFFLICQYLSLPSHTFLSMLLSVSEISFICQCLTLLLISLPREKSVLSVSVFVFLVSFICMNPFTSIFGASL